MQIARTRHGALGLIVQEGSSLCFRRRTAPNKASFLSFTTPSDLKAKHQLHHHSIGDCHKKVIETIPPGVLKLTGYPTEQIQAKRAFHRQKASVCLQNLLHKSKTSTYPSPEDVGTTAIFHAAAQIWAWRYAAHVLETASTRNTGAHRRQRGS